MTVKASGPRPAQVEGGEVPPLPLSHVLMDEYRVLHGEVAPALDEAYRKLERLRPLHLTQAGLTVKLAIHPKCWGARRPDPQHQARVLTSWAKLRGRSLPVRLAIHPRCWGVRPRHRARVLASWAELPRATEEQDASVRIIEDAQLKIIYRAIHSLPLKGSPIKAVSHPKYWGVRPPDPQHQARMLTLWVKLRSKRSALCLSGGGIRSATFCLGVIQGLARRKLLGSFDYLSTVSGGGYIGSWLSAWIHRAGRREVIGALGQYPKSTLNPEPKEISHLRSYSNYLSPKLGLLSVDTWTLVAIYLRNLFLNWLMFLPLLLAVLLIPRMYVALIHRNFAFEANQILYDRLPLDYQIIFIWVRLQAGRGLEYQGYVLLALGLLLGSAGLAYIGSHRPSLRKAQKKSDRGRAVPGKNSDQGEADPDTLRNFLRSCLVPMAFSVVLLTTGRSWYLSSERAWTLLDFMLGGAFLHFLSVGITFLYVWRFFPKDFSDYRRNVKERLLELLVVTLTGGLGGAFLWLLSIVEKVRWDVFNPKRYPELYATFDGPQLMLVLLLMAILSVGLGRDWMADEDREWWARAGAWVMIAITVWAALNALVLFGPLLFSTLRTAQDKLSGSLLSLGLVSGFITILFGLSSKTPANDRQAEKIGWLAAVMDYGVKLAAPIFVLFLVVALSALTTLLIILIKWVPQIWSLSSADQWRTEWLRHGPSLTSATHHDVVYGSSFLFLFCLFAVLVGLSVFMTWCIDINQYSLHSMYRNRLVRAYLGASRRRRRPNSFTGFDPEDDIPVAHLWPGEGRAGRARTCHPEAGRPFHVVNMTWNLVQSKNLAWQNRKATTFTVTPLHCGSMHYGYRPAADYGGQYPDSISLGTAFTISGAAASPNMGYYSSSAVTFLMTLFNARLGWWLGNPAKGHYGKRGPEWALKPMIDEAFGKTEADKEYIYLSDGGHFENLGLYEMVLRRCHHIFVVDASRDPARMFENLGNAIRRIRVDLGVSIEIRGIVNKPAESDASGAYCAVGDIRYGEVDEAEGGARAEDGLLVYIKPALTGDEPTDIFNYARAHLEFPHESTGDQFFSEQQFESYRALGLHAVEQIFKASTQERDFSGLKDDLEKYLKASPGGKGADGGTASGSDLV